MSIILNIFGVVLLALGFWVLLTAFDRTGQERAYRIRAAVGSMMAGLGNILLMESQGLGIALILIGGLVVVTARRTST